VKHAGLKKLKIEAIGYGQWAVGKGFKKLLILQKTRDFSVEMKGNSIDEARYIG
jgi:hypothetical protein